MYGTGRSMSNRTSSSFHVPAPMEVTVVSHDRASRSFVGMDQAAAVPCVEGSTATCGRAAGSR